MFLNDSNLPFCEMYLVLCGLQTYLLHADTHGGNQSTGQGFGLKASIPVNLPRGPKSWLSFQVLSLVLLHGGLPFSHPQSSQGLLYLSSGALGKLTYFVSPSSGLRRSELPADTHFIPNKLLSISCLYSLHHYIQETHHLPITRALGWIRKSLLYTASAHICSLYPPAQYTQGVVQRLSQTQKNAFSPSLLLSLTGRFLINFILGAW